VVQQVLQELPGPREHQVDLVVRPLHNIQVVPLVLVDPLLLAHLELPQVLEHQQVLAQVEGEELALHNMKVCSWVHRQHSRNFHMALHFVL